MDIKLCNGRYKLVKKIGQGGFGSIFMGQNIKNGEFVAIKLELLKLESD